ncbi:apyrase-like [Epargyreus clarus]|uniref:apyrase-like n=1 Tax=Epargyreus clarus TaxID=520877 RepID=UPI003C2C6C52
MCLLLYFGLVSVVSVQVFTYDLNILHYNDFHARFVETSPAGTICNPQVAPCIGGFARLATVVRERLISEPESLVLNAGDSFQGTIWYNLLRWNVTQDFMNMIPHDAHVLGNHEFDNGIEGVVPYLEYLEAPVVTANIIDDEEPTIQGLYNSSIIVEKGGRKIGIIGVIIATTNVLASTGKLVFTDEVETVRREAEKLHDQGIDIIVVLSHCGMDIDREIALHGGPHIDIIVGGHSHTLLYNDDPPEESGFTPRGPYPVVVEQATRKVLIVQAAAHTQYLGEIKLHFDDDGNLLSWEGHPHFIGNSVVQAPDVLEKINYYLPKITEAANMEVGSSMVHLSSRCACGECNLGSLICDAFMHSVMDRAEGSNWHFAHFCIINQGGIRVDIEPGVITFESVLLSTPFENNVEVFELRGDHILEMLEFSVANEWYPGARMLQVSGLQPVFDGSKPRYERVMRVGVRCIDCDVPKYEPLQLDKYYRVISQSFIGTGGIHPVFDGSQPVGNRVVSVSIRCIECDVPKYEPLVPEKYYRIVSQDFIGNGGGGFNVISDNRVNVTVVGVDYDILMTYIRHQTPVFSEVDGRIQIQSPCSD